MKAVGQMHAFPGYGDKHVGAGRSPDLSLDYGAEVIPLERGIGLGVDNEEGVGLINHKQSLEIHVPAIEQVIRARIYDQMAQSIAFVTDKLAILRGV